MTTVCELCKKGPQRPGMQVVLKDVNGVMTVNVCQACLKKLKTAVRTAGPLVIEIYKEQKG